MTTPILSVLMPVRGRAAQTVALIPRLFATSGDTPWELIIASDDDAEVAHAIHMLNERQAEKDAPRARLVELRPRRGYWNALAAASAHARGRLLANIANDVLPGLGWVTRIVETFDRLFQDGLGVVGWNDGLLFDGHTGHLVIGRALAERWYGPACWPTFYDHLWGDVEICQRAMAEDRYAVDLRAVLYHNHFLLGQTMDNGYRESHRREHADEEMFYRRRSLGWPSATSSS